MAYTSVKIKYYNGGQYNKSVVLYNTQKDFDKFCDMIRKAQFTPPARKQAYNNNLVNLVVWLDKQYCDTGFFLNNLYQDMFVAGQELLKLLTILEKDNATEQDFQALEII